MPTGTRHRQPDGNFAPVREERTVTELAVTGAIPDHLDGRYLRNGSNPLAQPDPTGDHEFVGMVHGVRLRDGRAEWYRNRWVRSRDVARALGEPPRPGRIHAAIDTAPNTHVIGHAGRTFAITEGGARPYELDDALDTIGPCDFDGTLPGGYASHPLADPATGELHAVSYFFAWGNKVQYSILGTDGRIRRTVDIDVAGNPVMHAFSLTERYVVIYDLPLPHDPDAAAAAAPASTARVGAMPRTGDGSDVRWFDVEPCHVYHPLNAFDDGERIVLNVVRHARRRTADRRSPSSGDASPTLDRWTIDLAAGTVEEKRLDDRGQEFPRVDERLVGRRHRYGYTAAMYPDTNGPTNALLKHDLATGRSQVRTFSRGAGVGEFLFVPAAPDAREDEGVLMGFVYDRRTDRSNLEVLDAETLETVASVHLPTRVPYGFHGSWVPTI